MGKRKQNKLAPKYTDYSHLFYGILSGFLLFLSFPKYGNGLVAFIALVPLFYALRETNVIQGIRIGILAGLVFNLGILYWIVFVVVTYGNMPVYFGVGALLLLSLYLSLYMGAFAGAFVFFRRRGINEFISAPTIWVVIEYVKSHLLTGFPWENLGYSQYQFIPIVQVADLTGVYGISFVIVLVNIAIYRLIWGKETRRVAIECFSALLLIIALYLYGLWRINDMETIMTYSRELKVALVQGNIDQNIKWNPAYQDETINIYRELSLKAIPEGKGLIVWPETATPFYFQEIGEKQSRVREISALTGNWLFFGSPSYRKEGGHVTYFNSAFLLQSDGEIVGKYDKVHLVPYGEYVPLRRYFPFLSKLVVGLGDFSSGTGYFPLVVDGIRVGPLICYEAIFPEGTLSYKRSGADLLINITNDAWFGRTSAPYQHLSMAALRAVESRLFVVRAANTGVSAVIDPTGRVVAKTNLFERTRLDYTVKLIETSTIYVRYGDMFVFICILYLIVMITTDYMRRKYHGRRNS